MNLRNVSVMAAVGMCVLAVGGRAWAHCQIPCGIYGDETRFSLMKEHVATIEKSMKQIVELGGKKGASQNQAVRWVANKDEHAAELTEIVTYYFMAQRVKPAPASDKKAHAKYVESVTTLHQIVVHAMKAKQSTDLTHVAKLKQLIDAFEVLYLGK